MSYPPEIEPLTGSLAESGYVNPKLGTPHKNYCTFCCANSYQLQISEIREYEIFK